MVQLMHCTQLGGGGGFMPLPGLQVHFPVHFTVDLHMHFTKRVIFPRHLTPQPL